MHKRRAAMQDLELNVVPRPRKGGGVHVEIGLPRLVCCVVDVLRTVLVSFETDCPTTSFGTWGTGPGEHVTTWLFHLFGKWHAE